MGEMKCNAQGGNWYRGAANWLENRLNGTLVQGEPHDDRAMMREAMAKLNQAADEIDRLHHVERLAARFVSAKGRYHSQQAMCDLMEHFGKPCVRPDKQGDKPYRESELPKVWESYRHKNGALYRVESVSNMDSGRPEYPVTVTYRGEDGRLWSKTLGEFLRKMTRVSEEALERGEGE
ncbi:hypothetical protein MHM84_03405 [Halomonas sp. McH1-25]|uniref:hypothetical protein n=1 Tax=unclassified Halomonas TaxID=2609666 RepID=UPI001EF65067|nr:MULTISPECIES: hypothetical protein [unclassified Halomonas]MCG7598818.1 hypothetical protein [Halomonas sp. McH1-25]MCP1340781.1 hypothetical protein [Halomonas sp. FL8]MCP1362204.1 hypothetical protein [Halomonas sp. BBD45]MCP1364823.1 hypothetical protein [Halomonas sp. BBD48]